MIPTTKEASSAATDYLDLPIRIITGFDEREAPETHLNRLVQVVAGGPESKVGTFTNARRDDASHEQLAIVVCHDFWPMLDRLADQHYHALTSTLVDARAILWISERSMSSEQCLQDTMITGFARTLRLERTGLVFTQSILTGPKELLRGLSPKHCATQLRVPGKEYTSRNWCKLLACWRFREPMKTIILTK